MSAGSSISQGPLAQARVAGRPALRRSRWLRDWPVPIAGSGAVAEYAAALLTSLGARVVCTADRPDPHPAIEWARSGAMALTGPSDGAPLLAPAALASCARAALAALRRVAPGPGPRLDAAALLGERAAILGLSRRGATSAGGSCRLLRTADGWIALNLARPDDASLLPAWLGEGDTGNAWRFAAERIRHRSTAALVERARLLGLPAAAAGPAAAIPAPWLRVSSHGTARARSAADGARVLDLSSLWAGPLCAHLLGLSGASVVKVESRHRPDGARFGPPAFFDLLNAGKQSVALDLTQAAGRARLLRLIERADIVVESARPRALQQMGICAEALIERRPGLTWVSITGYGRREPQAAWVAFGDDAAAAAGLAEATGSRESPLFCGDAIADPLTGIHAALAALASWRAGGGHLLDLSLRDVVAHVLARDDRSRDASVREVDGGFTVHAGGAKAVVAPPRARITIGKARPLGADTRALAGDGAPSC